MNPHLNFSLTRHEFMQQSFEQKPLLIEGCFDASAFGWQLIDEALSLQDPRRELLKVLKGGRVETEEYIEEFTDIGIPRRRILKDKLYSHLVNGATIVLNRIELISPAMQDLCMQVGRLVGTQTTGNVYACLGGEPATNVHWDTHDVFVLQLTGAKEWKIYEPTFPLPLSNQVSNDLKGEAPETPYLRHCLKAGDALYVPRGWWHRVTPIDGEETIHLTVAIHTPLILDYLIWACGNLLPGFLQLRHAMVGRPTEEALVKDAMLATVKTLLDPKSIDAFRERSKERERVVTPFQINRLLRTPGAFDDRDHVRINARSAASGDQIHLINGKRVGTDGPLTEVLRQLSSTTEMTLENLQESIPELDRATVEALLRGLMRADVVEVVSR